MTAVYERLNDAHSKDRYLLASKSENIDMASFCDQRRCTKGKVDWSGDFEVTIEVGLWVPGGGINGCWQSHRWSNTPDPCLSVYSVYDEVIDDPTLLILVRQFTLLTTVTDDPKLLIHICQFTPFMIKSQMIKDDPTLPILVSLLHLWQSHRWSQMIHHSLSLFVSLLHLWHGHRWSASEK